MNYLNSIISRTTIQTQLFFTVAIGIVLLLVALILASIWVSDQQVRKVLIKQGMQATSNLAKSTSLALIYDSPNNAKAAIKSTLAFPGVISADIYKPDRSLFYCSVEDGARDVKHELHDKNFINASGETQIVDEDESNWYFFAPVLVEPDDQSINDELFASQSSDNEKLIGYVFVTVSKESLKAIDSGILFSNSIIVFVIGLLLLFTLKKTIKRLTKPLYSISSIMKNAEQGEYASHVEVDGPEEFRHIAGAYNRMIGVLADRDEMLRKQNVSLEKQAVHDHLTGLMNRTGFEKSLKLAIEESKISEAQHALCYMDLDKFKIINDSCGHNAGDDLLKNICKVLSRHIREDSDVLARVGGDEFSLILKNCSLEKARDICENICEDINNYRFIWGEKVFSVGISIGITLLDAKAGAIHNIVSKADKACYVAKEKGRGQVYVSTDDDQVSIKGEAQMADHIIDHLDNNKFRLLCQRIIPLNDDGPIQHRFEMQLQMTDEDGRTIEQDRFSSSAERYGLMSRIDHWVVRSVLEVLSKNTVFSQNLNLCAVNISAASLNDEQFVEFIKEQFNHFRIDPHVICFEITEMVAINNIARVERFIHDVHDMGCQVALDGFVSNSSSFLHIKKMNIDYLKIHGDLFKDIIGNPVSHAMAKSINEIAHIMNIKTIAEYVDDGKVLAELSALGIDYVQGDAIAEPVVIEEFIERQEAV